MESSVDSTNSVPNLKRLSHSLKKTNRLGLLLAIGLMLNAVVWSGALLLIKKQASTYTSKGAAIIAALGTQGSVDIPEVGSTSDASSKTPYGYLLKVDPRENYQYIARTEAVLSEAAAASGVSLEDFGTPGIFLNRGTSIIEFEISGSSPEKAQQKARAFYQAWVERISQLREEEAARQDSNVVTQMESAAERLEAVQERISEFRSSSPLKVSNQIESLSLQMEDLRERRAEVIVEKEALDARFRSISSQLNISPQQAADALILLDDKVFQSSLQNYSEAVSNLQVLSSTWSVNSPQVSAEEDKREAARAEMLERSRSLLGREMDMDFLMRLDLGGGGRRDFVEELIRLQIEREDLVDRTSSIGRQIEQLEFRLKVLAREQYKLSHLEREMQISESIFTESIGRLDVDKPDYATYYPSLQLIAEPTLPNEEVNSSSDTIVLGAIGFSILSTTGILILWWERSQHKSIFYRPSSSQS